mmetsp:Transcript_70277/g.187255  ORF Transcript_70277/g.187255 Transcript_70277/m.187255 type:complete len:117 (-) Transcript_70277:563-913(-)
MSAIFALPAALIAVRPAVPLSVDVRKASNKLKFAVLLLSESGHFGQTLLQRLHAFRDLDLNRFDKLSMRLGQFLLGQPLLLLQTLHHVCKRLVGEKRISWTCAEDLSQCQSNPQKG